MKIANVNAGNRKPDWSRLRDWLQGQGQRPDIVTLQKIGSGEPSLEQDFRDIRYEGWFLYHEKHYLGVAILADHDFLSGHDPSLPKVLDCELPGDDEYESLFPNEARFLIVSIGNLSISSVYAPYGPQPLGERRAIERRVAWLNRLRDHVRSKGRDRWIMCGDFNVKADGPPWGKFYSEEEKDALDGLGFCDLYRKAHPCVTESPGLTRGYSEEDGTTGSSRLHLMLASKSLVPRRLSARVEVEPKP